MAKKCPVCNSRKGVREFLYGMPVKEPDYGRYLLGGCCISDDMPDYRCLKCGTDFYKDSSKLISRFQSDGSGINFQCRSCKEWVASISEIDWHICN